MKNRGCAYFFFAIFAIAGLVCGIAGFWMVRERFQILHEGIKTTATVIDLSYSKNTVAPIFEYKDEWGNDLRYASNFYTNIDPYEIGDQVSLYYLPSNPEKVAVEGIGWENWFPFLFLFSHGGIGFGGLFWLEKKRRLYNWLQEQGQELQIPLSSVKEAYNKRKYYTLIGQWMDPYTQASFTFESDALTRNPLESIALGANIRVLIDPNNPKRYWMDTAFLDG